jgi:DNA polymerase
MEKDNREEILKEIKEEVINFKKSPLFSVRVKNKVHPVIGEGSHYAKIMFIGEAPGKNESETGRPFCGAAGKVLSEMLESINLKREDVYITNIVKDRPPNNRDPLPKEIEMYATFLDRQIDAIKPEIIVTLGRFSMIYLMQKFGLQKDLASISKIHGKVFEANTNFGNVKIIPLYHPAAVLYQNGLKKDLVLDFKKIKNIL